MCGSGSVTFSPRYEHCSSQSLRPLQHVLGIQKQYFAWKCPENTDYLIPNTFQNSSLSLIAHEFAEYIYPIFLQIGAKLTEIFTILWKHPKQEISICAFGSDISCNPSKSTIGCFTTSFLSLFCMPFMVPFFDMAKKCFHRFLKVCIKGVEAFYALFSFFGSVLWLFFHPIKKLDHVFA